MKFDPKSILEKSGWSEGQGLGKNNQGRKEAVKAVYKFDKTGLGHDFSKEFKVHHEWSQQLDATIKNLKVVATEDGGVQIQTTAAPPKKTAGNFVKSSRLNNGERAEPKDDDNSSSDSEIESSVSKFTDEDLIKACGGLTAHSAARHGIYQSAKQARLRAQDAETRKVSNDTGMDEKEIVVMQNIEVVPEVQERKKKSKRNKSNADEKVADEILNRPVDTKCKPKKKSKKERNIEVNPDVASNAEAEDVRDDENLEISEDVENRIPEDLGGDGETRKKKRKHRGEVEEDKPVRSKKRKRCDDEEENCSERRAVVDADELVAEEDASIKKTTKSKKTKVEDKIAEDCGTSASETKIPESSVDEVRTKNKKSKKKKVPKVNN